MVLKQTNRARIAIVINKKVLFLSFFIFALISALSALVFMLCLSVPFSRMQAVSCAISALQA